jgi:hypothetical protein
MVAVLENEVDVPDDVKALLTMELLLAINDDQTANNILLAPFAPKANKKDSNPFPRLENCLPQLQECLTILLQTQISREHTNDDVRMVRVLMLDDLPCLITMTASHD